MIHRCVGAAAVVMAGLILGAGDRAASASALRFERLPESARPRPADLMELGWGRRVNALGQSIEDSRDQMGPGNWVARGYIVSDGERTDLGDLGGDYVVPYGINDRGQVVGTATDVIPSSGNPYWRAFLWEDGRMIDLAPDRPEWSLHAYAINNAGQVVGGNENGMWGGEAFLYQDGEFRPLGTLGGRTSVARSINEAGLIVGASDGPRRPEPWFPYHTYEERRAMLVEDGLMYDLNDLTVDLGDWLLREAMAITDDGWILTYGSPKDGGVIEWSWLKPIEWDSDSDPDPIPGANPIPGTGPTPEPIPEPASVALWAGILAAGVAWRRRRARS